jgi:hypothetical protein
VLLSFDEKPQLSEQNTDSCPSQNINKPKIEMSLSRYQLPAEYSATLKTKQQNHIYSILVLEKGQIQEG